MTSEDAIEPITPLKRQSESIKKALFLLKSLAQGDEDYRQGRSFDHDDVKKDIAAKLEGLKRHGKKI